MKDTAKQRKNEGSRYKNLNNLPRTICLVPPISSSERLDGNPENRPPPMMIGLDHRAVINSPPEIA
jgi:hypothetical protein